MMIVNLLLHRLFIELDSDGLPMCRDEHKHNSIIDAIFSIITDETEQVYNISMFNLYIYIYALVELNYKYVLRE